MKEEWQELFYVVFWDKKKESIKINKQQSDNIRNAIIGGAKYIDIGACFLAVSSIEMIKPRYGYDNVPPKPAKISNPNEDGSVSLIDSPEQKEWDKLFGHKERILLN